MKITDVKATIAAMGEFEWVFTRIYTSNGLVGTGEARGKAGYSSKGIKEAVLDMKPLLIGEDPTEVRKLGFRVNRSMRTSLGGLAAHAWAALDIALWDLAGKSVGWPVYRLLGGRLRDRVKVYCDCGYGEGGEYTPEAFVEKAENRRTLGFKTLKFDVHHPSHGFHTGLSTISSRELELMKSCVSAIRERLRGDVDLALDCHWRYSVMDAVRLAHTLEGFDLLWLEDPVYAFGPEGVEALAAVSAATRTPICAGENMYAAYDFLELLQRRAASVISPDIGKIGLTEGMKVADIAGVYNVIVAPHNTNSPLGTVAACHLCAAMPNFLSLEYHYQDWPAWSTIIGEKQLVKDGFIEVPSKPGLGVELNGQAVTEYLLPGETFFE
ncbi:MAG: mandelate racemase/muconate lactonizing enzyme family protein [Candidatus Bathyarchaeia archaeon]